MANEMLGQRGTGSGADVSQCASLTAPISLPEATRTADRFAALGHPRRIQLMNMLVRSGFPVCVCDLVAVTGWAQSTVSHHLKQLVDAGLLHREQRGRWAYYSADHEGLASLADIVSVPAADFGLAVRS
ncbi:ArsR/SmtB family transcription factor [Catenulispora rubra]|uniref:ArsR/SmtB family transcription factor n=1 Tax=Catenulispora rubra TaxID=280293 RepID=UPI001E2DCB10|nr:metalloregulator ArsR/SmtB family transcription factor [Catenulispora rubra]